MKPDLKIVNNEEGSILITAVMFIIALTAIGVTLIKISDFELKMATNDKCQKNAFFNGEAGLWGMSKVVRRSLEQAQLVNPNDPEYPGVTRSSATSATDDEIYDEMSGFSSASRGQKDFRLFDNSNITAVIDADVNVAYTTSAQIRGNAIEFASGYEGLAGGGAGSNAIFYNITSEGRGCNNANFTVNGQYRWMIGVPGGL